ncbi:IMP dehydrogenase, partial [Bacillus mycoides]|uniref:IMP dehydrogenase n=1 Tax=Bacillus mycoides TaxID=1405 RepID=UPI001C92DC12
QIYQPRQFKLYPPIPSVAPIQKPTKDPYFQQPNEKLLPQDIKGPLPYKPPLPHTLHRLLRPLPPPIPYSPANHLQFLPQNPQFIGMSGA